MPPELAADLIDFGITLAGGGALLKNLDLLLRSETKLPIKIAADPLSAVAVGAGMALSNLEILRNLEKFAPAREAVRTRSQKTGWSIGKPETLEP
jgi:actin-like ATPase involved in cell morphogenesis